MKRAEIYALICETAQLPANSVSGNEQLAVLPGWDSMAGVEFQRLVADRWDVELNGLRVVEARNVAGLVALFGDRIED